MRLDLNSTLRPHARRKKARTKCRNIFDHEYHGRRTLSLKDMSGHKNCSLDTCGFGPQQVPDSPPRPHAGGGKKTSCWWIVQNAHLPWVGVGSHYPAPPVPVLLLLYTNQGWIATQTLVDPEFLICATELLS